MGFQLIDLSGKRFGRWTVIDRSLTITKIAKWNCVCDCGSKKEVFGHSLRHGKSMSCGCYNREVITKHGQSQTKEFRQWWSMIRRCEYPGDKSFTNYGGRGIKVCERWRNSFLDYLADMGIKPTPKHSLDRINNDGNYEPNNCRWATPIQQHNNTRTNRLLTLQNKTLTVSEWCTITGITYHALHNRLRRGWKLAEALSRPVRNYSV